MPKVQSFSRNRIFNKYHFNEIQDFESFHIAFLNVCNDFNAALPGKHFKLPPLEKIKEWYNENWKPIKDDETKKDARKKLFLDFMANNISESKSNQGAVIIVGMVAPTVAMVLKRSWAQRKKFYLHLIPDVVFVPSCTLLAFVGAKVLQVNMGRGTPAK